MRQTMVHLLLAILERAVRHAKSQTSAAITDVVRLIQASPGQDVQLRDLARQTHLSLSRFKARFKMETGVSPRQFLLRTRIEVAKRRLAAEGESVTRVAMSLGFSSSQYFATVFKRITGMTLEPTCAGPLCRAQVIGTTTASIERHNYRLTRVSHTAAIGCFPAIDEIRREARNMNTEEKLLDAGREEDRRSLRRGVSVVMAISLLGVVPAFAEVTGIKIAKDETISVGATNGPASGGGGLGNSRAERTGHPHARQGGRAEVRVGLRVVAAACRRQRAVLVLGAQPRQREGGTARRYPPPRRRYGWCAWQAKNVAPSKAQLKLTGYEGPMPQAYGLVVVRDFVSFLRYASEAGTRPNPAAGKVKFAFAYGVSQSGRFMRTFLLHGLNAAPAGKVFDGLLPNGARAGYIDFFRPDSEPGSGGKFSSETVYAPYSWSELMARSRTDAKVIALNAESEYYEMMAYMTHHGPVPENVRVYDFPLGGHGGGPARCRGENASSRCWSCWRSGYRAGPSRPTAGCSSSRSVKARGPRICRRSRRNSRRLMSWALPRAACGFRRSRCRLSVTSPRWQSPHTRAAGQGGAYPPLRHAGELPYEGGRGSGSPHSRPLPARIGAGEIHRGRREGHLVKRPAARCGRWQTGQSRPTKRELNHEHLQSGAKRGRERGNNGLPKISRGRRSV